MIAIGRAWELWAHRYAAKDGVLRNIGAQGWVELHGLDEPVVPVLVEEVLGDPYAPEVTHYGWENLEYPRRAPSLIQLRCRLTPTDQRPERALMALDMCFPYGVVVEVAHGSGKILALRVTERSETP